MFPRSEHAFQSLHIQIERLKEVSFYLFFCSLALGETKGAEVTQLDYQHKRNLEKTVGTACTATLHFFRRAN